MKFRDEFGKRCDLCRKNRESHMSPFIVRGEYLRLCKECWDKVTKEVLFKLQGGSDSLHYGCRNERNCKQ